ncbi:hypothetical protein TNCV_5070181 [Trichonephila clavipes]|nr:hypothetical protein TNCV_5070181 [Trichonephila clavipes]
MMVGNGGTSSRRPSSWRPCGTTEREDRPIRLWRIIQRLRQKFELHWIAQWHNELLEIGYFKDSSAPWSMYSTDSKPLRHAGAHWRTE